MNLAILNGVKDLIIAEANKEGRNLADDFKTAEDFKQFVVAFTIRGCVEILGMDVSDAFDLVMGEGEFQRLADECWEQLQGE